MTNDETNPTDQMTKRSHLPLSGFVLRYSFDIRHSAFGIALALIIGITSAFGQKRPITEKDLWDFVWIGDPQISPDGTHIAFVRITVNEKKDGYNTSIWSVPVANDEAP